MKKNAIFLAIVFFGFGVVFTLLRIGMKQFIAGTIIWGLFCMALALLGTKQKKSEYDFIITNENDKEELVYADEALVVLAKFKSVFSDKDLRKELKDVLDISYLIHEFVKNNPDSKNSVRKFYTYYLPNLVDICNKMLDVEQKKDFLVDYANIKEKTLAFFDETEEAFKTMYNDLYKAEIDDLDSSLSVATKVMQSDGLNNNDFSQGGL